MLKKLKMPDNKKFSQGFFDGINSPMGSIA